MIRIGTVGTGFIVDDFFDAVSRVDGVEITCVYSRDAEKAEAFAKKHGLTNYSSDREAFLADESLDFIYVASPNSLHYSWSRDALLAGRNVICEKPFVSNLKEAEDLAAIAKEKGLFLFEAITVPHLPNFALVKEHLAELGTLRLVQMNFSQYSSRYKAYLDGKNPNVFNPEFSGGALMDINYYNLYFAVELFGEPKEIRYFANLVENGIDTSGILILRYDNFVAELTGAKDSRSKNFVSIQGDKGFLYQPLESSRCLSFTVTTADGETEYNEQSDSNVLYYEVCDFAKIYNANDLAACYEKLDHSLRMTRLTEAARKDAGIVFPADER